MNHPNVDELTGFLYDDNDGLEPARVQEIRAHVAQCEQCRARVSAWRGVRSDLATWTLPNLQDVSPAVAFRPGFLRPALKWAVAASVLMGAGFGLARMNQQKPADLSALRAELAGEIRAELRAELGGELAAAQARFASEQAARNEAFEQAVVRGFGELEARQTVAHAALRKDVETLAVRAQQGFEQIAYAAQADEDADEPQQQ
jgi:hypothetical protein